MAIPGWQALFSDYKTTIHYANRTSVGARVRNGNGSGVYSTPVTDCPPHTQRCVVGGRLECTNLLWDADNCGSCGHRCFVSQTCCRGVCLQNDEQHCGSHCPRCADNEHCCLIQRAWGAEYECVPFGTNEHCSVCEPCVGIDTCCPPDGCVNVRTDDRHCGVCDNPCTADKFCMDGHCVCRPPKGPCGDECCDPNETCCREGCRDLQTDNNSCGTCDNACIGGKTCQNGQCVCPAGRDPCGNVCCGPGETCCPDGCRNLNTDDNNCGTCGYPCTGGKTCQNGLCFCPARRNPCGSVCCGPGETCCPDGCRNLNTDDNNCGTCGYPCTGVKTCQNGVCTCPSGRATCGSICCGPSETCCGGTCTNTMTDFSNCGGCGQPCHSPEAVICKNGICSCRPGWVDCGDCCCMPVGATCCDPANGHYCPPGKECCGAGCCPEGQNCCRSEEHTS